MRQHWGKLLFMHWPLDVETLRPFVPGQLSIDTFDGKAWIGVVPFTMWGIRASFLPPLPGASAFHELNVRTYVHYQGVPGVWFFSLDAANSLAVWGARTFYHLPYFNAEMKLDQQEKTIRYSSVRTDRITYAEFFSAESAHFSKDFQSANKPDSPRGELEMNWEIGASLAQAQVGSIEFFLTERYCLYALHEGGIYRSRIFHEPWPLQTAAIGSCRSNMIESLGISRPGGPPLLHYAEAIAVDIWPLKRTTD
jgi:uncharacterized protein YqjF (DUF2071 family)